MRKHIEEWRTILKAKGYYQESVGPDGHHFYKSEHDLNPLGIPVDEEGYVSEVMCAVIEYLLAIDESDDAGRE